MRILVLSSLCSLSVGLRINKITPHENKTASHNVTFSRQATTVATSLAAEFSQCFSPSLGCANIARPFLNICCKFCSWESSCGAFWAKQSTGSAMLQWYAGADNTCSQKPFLTVWLKDAPQMPALHVGRGFNFKLNTCYTVDTYPFIDTRSLVCRCASDIGNRIASAHHQLGFQGTLGYMCFRFSDDKCTISSMKTKGDGGNGNYYLEPRLSIAGLNLGGTYDTSQKGRCFAQEWDTWWRGRMGHSEGQGTGGFNLQRMEGQMPLAMPWATKTREGWDYGSRVWLSANFNLVPKESSSVNRGCTLPIQLSQDATYDQAGTNIGR